MNSTTALLLLSEWLTFRMDDSWDSFFYSQCCSASVKILLTIFCDFCGHLFHPSAAKLMDSDQTSDPELLIWSVWRERQMTSKVDSKSRSRIHEWPAKYEFVCWPLTFIFNSGPHLATFKMDNQVYLPHSTKHSECSNRLSTHWSNELEDESWARCYSTDISVYEKTDSLR